MSSGDLAIPQDALDRLSRNRAGQAGAVFTSDLSVNEFLLVREAGFAPLGLVMGSSIYNVGIQMTSWGRNMELTTLSQAMYHARELAMTRMQAEAEALDADGIVGVRLHVNPQGWGGNRVAEFIAIGTAVVAEGRSWHRHGDRAFTSDLSGQDFWTLLQAGYAPLALVMGTCVYHVAHRSPGQRLSMIGGNAEIPQFTQAIYDARELAMGRMQQEAVLADAAGVVGVVLDENIHVWGHHATEFLAVGTAVTPISDTHTVPPPQMVVGLDR